MTTRTIYHLRDDPAPPPSPATERGSSLLGPSRLADLVYGVWAITPAYLQELQAIYEAHLRGPIDLASVEAKLGRPLANEQRGYTVTNGVAVLPVEGVIAPKANMITKISGGASAQLLAREMRAAGADPNVQSVIHLLDTPGGNVLGIPEYAQAVREVASVKPVVSFTDGQMASAGYWAGSAGNQVFASGPTVEVGSIGVIATHRDMSAANEREGVKVTHITAGKYKAVGSPHQPLSKADRNSLQESVDYCYSLFVDAVAANRGVSTDVVLEHMADGRVFRGQQALDAGLVDGFSSLDALIESMATDPARFAKRTTARIKAVTPKSASASAARADASPTPQKERSPMSANEGAAATAPSITVETIQREHPHVHSAIFAAGAAAERTRVAGIREATVKGHEALAEAFIADGKTTPGDAAMAMCKAVKEHEVAAALAHAADAPAPAASAAAPADKPNKSRTEQRDEAVAYAAAHDISFVAALKKLGFD